MTSYGKKEKGQMIASVEEEEVAAWRRGAEVVAEAAWIIAGER